MRRGIDDGNATIPFCLGCWAEKGVCIRFQGHDATALPW